MSERPKSPYVYLIAVAKSYRVHQLRDDRDGKEAWCGKSNEKWFDQWITQGQLDALPSSSWCPKCLEAIGML